MIKIRLHRSDFEESKATLATINNRSELLTFLVTEIPQFTPLYFNDLTFELYYVIPDPSVGWNQTWLVSYKQQAIAFCSDDPSTLPET